MDSYHKQLLLAAAPADVFLALTTERGLRGWWTDTCRVEAPAVGNHATFRFGATFKVMRIDACTPDRELRWRCVAAHIAADSVRQRPDEWVGTTIEFRLAALADGRTQLDVVHRGLVPELHCWSLCSAGWDQVLASLAAYVATGQGAPCGTDGCGHGAATTAVADATATALHHR